PRTIAFIEEYVRKIVKQHLSRGRVDVYIEYENIEESLCEVEPNKPLVDLYLKAFNEVEREFKIENDVTINSLLEIPDMFLIHQGLEDEELMTSLTYDAMEDAISSLKEMRSIEGKKLKEDILKRACY